MKNHNLTIPVVIWIIVALYCCITYGQPAIYITSAITVVLSIFTIEHCIDE